MPRAGASTGRPRSVRPCIASRAGRTNTSNETAALTGLPGQAEEQRSLRRDAEPLRLARLHGDLREGHGAGELVLDHLVGPRADAAREDDDVCRLRTRAAPRRGRAALSALRPVVGDRGHAHDLSARSCHERREQGAVGLGDLPALQRHARCDELVPVETTTTRGARDTDTSGMPAAAAAAS